MTIVKNRQNQQPSHPLLAHRVRIKQGRAYDENGNPIIQIYRINVINPPPDTTMVQIREALDALEVPYFMVLVSVDDQE